MPASRVLPGLDLARLAGWLPGALPGAGRYLSGRLIAGGQSSLTCEVTDGMSTWIVRRPPLGHVLATAHDMSREYRVTWALQSTAVPVPGTLALCQDEEVPGATFYVMAEVAGTPYRCAAELAELGRNGPGSSRPAWSTGWLPSITSIRPPSIRPPSVWPTSGRRTGSSAVRSGAGRSSWTRRTAAICPQPTSSTPVWLRTSLLSRRPASCTATTGWTTCSSTTRTAWPPCSTGRWPRWGIR